MLKKLFCAVALAALTMTAIAMTGAVADGGHGDKVTLLFESPLANVPGKSIKGVLVEYAPGGTSPAHTHPNSAFIAATVLEGAILSQVNDGPVTVYKAGETFFEKAGDHHGVSENASKTEPAKLLAVFVVDTDEQVLTTNDAE